MDQDSTTDSSSRNWALAAHLCGAFGGYLIPFGGVLGPLLIWLTKKEDDAFIGEHALEALNFRITFWLAMLVCVPLAFVVIGIPLALAAVVGSWVLGIVAASKASAGESYRYPFCLRLVTG